MDPNKINIEKESTTYKIKAEYHSDLRCQNYDVCMTAIENSDGTITFEPKDGTNFVFKSSDPDRVIALAKMMLAFAERNKYNSIITKKTIDISNNEC